MRVVVKRSADTNRSDVMFHTLDPWGGVGAAPERRGSALVRRAEQLVGHAVVEGDLLHDRKRAVEQRTRRQQMASRIADQSSVIPGATQVQVDDAGEESR